MFNSNVYISLQKIPKSDKLRARYLRENGGVKFESGFLKMAQY